MNTPWKERALAGTVRAGQGKDIRPGEKGRRKNLSGSPNSCYHVSVQNHRKEEPGMQPLSNAITAEKERSFALAQLTVEVISAVLAPGPNVAGRSADDIAAAIKQVYAALDSVVQK
jgi:hypothetical protein